MNKIALKKFVIIRYLSSCKKYPYGYGIYEDNVGNLRLTSLISHILYDHNPEEDSIIRDDAKRILKYIDTKDKKYLMGAFTPYYRNKLIEYIA